MYYSFHESVLQFVRKLVDLTPSAKHRLIRRMNMYWDPHNRLSVEKAYLASDGYPAGHFYIH